MSNVESAPSGIIFVVIGLITVLVLLFTLCNSGGNKSKNVNELYEEKVNSGNYTATVTGTHEYRKDINGHVYVRNDTTTVID